MDLQRLPDVEQELVTYRKDRDRGSTPLNSCTVAAAARVGYPAIS
jgi:hypothetical protein